MSEFVEVEISQEIQIEMRAVANSCEARYISFGTVLFFRMEVLRRKRSIALCEHPLPWDILKAVTVCSCYTVSKGSFITGSVAEALALSFAVNCVEWLRAGENSALAVRY